MGIFDNLKDRAIQKEMERRIVNISATRQNLPASCQDLHKYLNDMERLCLPTGNLDASARRDQLIKIASDFEAARSEQIAIGLRCISLKKVAGMYLELIDRCFALDFLELLNKGLSEAGALPVICSSNNITILRFAGLAPAYFLTLDWKNKNAFSEFTGFLSQQFSEKYNIIEEVYLKNIEHIAAGILKKSSVAEKINAVSENASKFMETGTAPSKSVDIQWFVGAVIISGRLGDMYNMLNNWLIKICEEHRIS